MSIRVRIAPSPTGPIHVGNVHTALFNWLWARKVGGKFILRFEDTDQERSRAEWEQVIFEDLAWFGMDWDEGPDNGGPHAPYRQMARLDLYREYTKKLLDGGHVYKCYCTKDEEEADRKEAQAQNKTYQYKGRCRNLAPEQESAFAAEGRPYVLRFRVPKGEVLRFNDLVRGPIEFDTDTVGDFIIMRANGIPLYNFAVVIDDLTMEITHILRGEGHISNTPVQLLIYNALGLPVPEIGHLGHMTNEDRGKLSKRKGEAAIRDYREQGYLPDALMNFMSLLGWTPPGAEAGREILTRDELIREFDIAKCTKAPSVFDKTKLNWMNGMYIRQKSHDELAELVLPFVVQAGIYTEEQARANWDWYRQVVAQVQTRVETLTQVPEQTDIFFMDQIAVNEQAAAKFLTDGVKPFFQKLIESLKTVAWELPVVEAEVRRIQEEMGLKPKESFQPIRVAITGRTESPGLFETIYLIGRERTIERLTKYA